MNLILADNSLIEVSEQSVRDQARKQPAGDASRAEVKIDGRTIELLALLAAVTSLGEEAFSLGEAIRLMKNMNIEVVSQPARSARPPQERELPEPERRRSEPTVYPSKEARRLHGQWVALGVDDGKLLGSEPNLRDLLTKVDARESSVRWIPAFSRRPEQP